MTTTHDSLGKKLYYRSLKRNAILFFLGGEIVDIFASLTKRGKVSSKLHEIEKICFFIGPPRSGTSLLGSILDAHPNMIISHEINILKYFRCGLKLSQIVAIIMANSERIARQGRKGGGYNNQVKTGWQGKCELMNVIGDKKAALSSFQLAHNPDLINAVAKKAKAKLKFIYIVRNPFDTISTISRRNPKYADLGEAIGLYFNIIECTNYVIEHIPDNSIFICSLEKFIQKPEVHLSELCRFLNQDAMPWYIDKCRELLFPTPKKTMLHADWRAVHINRLKEFIRNDAVLNKFGYDSVPFI